ncbi:MAG: heavy metal transporter [Cyclobacteriaceae bacterium]|nr:MAG: heavy metal transporter [Cyclobacteriaceae bacterium]
MFEGRAAVLNEGKNTYLGAVMVGSAVVIMMLVLWEEFLFPIHVKLDTDRVVFSNHRSKLKKQAGIFLLIPIIFAVIYVLYAVNLIGFIIWAGICIISPVVGKLISGIKNYNDFLALTDDTIEYKNNEKEGVYELKNVKQIVLIKDETKVLHKIQLILTSGQVVLIDLDEMEIEAFYVSIDEYLNQHYKTLVREGASG